MNISHSICRRLCGYLSALAFLQLVAVGGLAQDSARQRTYSFDKDAIGQPPAGFTEALTAGGGPVKWHVVPASDAPSGKQVVAQLSADSTNTRYPLLVLDDFSAKDVDVSVRFRPISGKLDRAAGIVWRWQNPNNYFVVRANALENNVVAYQTVAGKRSSIGIKGDAKAYGVKAEVPSNLWSTLRVRMVGNAAEIWLNDKRLFEIETEAIVSTGQVGLWTKADSVTQFDDLKVTGLDGREPSSAETTDREKPLVWSVSHTSEPPEIDGKAEALWDKARPLTVTVRKAMDPHKSRCVVLRALHTQDTLYVLAQWPDATRSDLRDPYVWNQAKRIYERPTRPDDQFALEFPLQGNFDINMLAVGRDYTADVWHWKAGRGNPAGWVDDKTHVISTRGVPAAQEYILGSRAKVYIARLMDAGMPSYRELPRPKTFRGDVVDSYEPCEPAGSLADVRGKGLHDGNGWTLEMARRFDTGHDDDTVLDPSQPIPCAIAVLDDELYWEHYVSPAITLRIEQESH